jgi:hypothetical protein
MAHKKRRGGARRCRLPQNVDSQTLGGFATAPPERKRGQGAAKKCN